MKKIFYIGAASLMLASCALDDNISPNDPSVDAVTPALYLAAAQTTSYDAQTSDIMLLSNVWMNNWAGNVYYYAAPLSNEYQMRVTATFQNPIWNDNYLALSNLATIYNHPQAADYVDHAAIAKILMANGMQYIVDFYGDAPFSEAFMRAANKTPKFDKSEDIYKNLVLMLNDAVTTIQTQTPKYRVEGEDVIFAGDMDQWVRLANTIKLRLLLRQSKVTDPAIRSFVDAQLQTLQGAQFVTTDVTINPGYSASSQNQQNPLMREYQYANFDMSTENIAGYKYIGNISEHFASLLTGTNPKTAGVGITVDTRGPLMYRVVGGTLRGIKQGDGQVPGGTEAAFSRLRWKYYQVTAGKLVNNSTSDGYIMVAAESEFLQAEAAELYPAIFTNAVGHYTAGVVASFKFAGIPTGLTDTAATTQAVTYLAALSTKPYGWNGSDGHIAAIQYQRMIALNLVKPQETYINYLKTGFPETPLATTATHPNKPWRLIYPSKEYNTNSNTPVLNEADVFVKNQFTPFWNRN